jgi:glycosidase
MPNVIYYEVQKPEVNQIIKPQFLEVISNARTRRPKVVSVKGRPVEITKPFPSPVDWRDHPIYFLMIDRFNNPETGPNKVWDEDCWEFQGGKINGIREELDYLKDLGVGAIWMTPPFKNPQSTDSYHGYGIQDFLSIDSNFGTEQELQDLVDEAHARGMYVIFDIVINHAGNVFGYHLHNGCVAEAPWRDYEYDICRGGNGTPDVFPQDLSHKEFFRRKGKMREGEEHELKGDFYSLKEFKTEKSEYSSVHGFYHPVQDILIKIYEYVIARYDIDGFRIDTLKHVEREFARIFGNAVREFALSIGKENFFTFGEVWASDEKIAKYTGRFASDPDDLVGVEASLDFPVFSKLPGVVKGFNAPSELAYLFDYRKNLHRGRKNNQVLISSHGEVSRFFVTFLDNHDQKHRFRYAPSTGPYIYDSQFVMGIASLFALQGIPCLYYGTEQGLRGFGNHLESVREALWGNTNGGQQPNAFDTNNQFFKAVKEIATVRKQNPALRYGRQYFRQVSGNGREFGLSCYKPGILAFSRILNDIEVIVVANASVNNSFSGFVIVDYSLNPPHKRMNILYSNKDKSNTTAGMVMEKPKYSVLIHEIEGYTTNGPARVLPISLEPMEIQFIG